MFDDPTDNAVSLRDVWHAGRTRRWHTHPFLSRTDDFLDGHHARVTKLMLALDPKVSRDALIAAMTHDDGEPKVGDMAYGVKNANPELYQQLEDLERRERDTLWGAPAAASEREQRLIKLCDWLDAWMWVAHHEPVVLTHPDWRLMRGRIEKLAAELGLWNRVIGVLSR